MKKYSLFLFLLLFLFACDESIDIYQEIHEPVEVTDLTEEVWDAIALYRENTNIIGIDYDTLETRQREFYNRYIDADGIPIVGNALTPDYHFINARKALLIMTAKHPDFRERFRKGFYYIIVGGHSGYYLDFDNVWRFTHGGDRPLISEVPKYHHVAQHIFFSGTLAFTSVPSSNGNRLYVGFCIADVVTGIRTYSMRIVVHEFAHALERSIISRDLNFNNELQNAFMNAIEKDLWGWGGSTRTDVGSRGEFFAERIEDFYYEIGPTSVTQQFDTVEDFIEYDPLTANLILKWFMHAPMQDLFSAEKVANELE